jgi:hypothetical protein
MISCNTIDFSGKSYASSNSSAIASYLLFNLNRHCWYLRSFGKSTVLPMSQLAGTLVSNVNELKSFGNFSHLRIKKNVFVKFSSSSGV